MVWLLAIVVILFLGTKRIIIFWLDQHIREKLSQVRDYTITYGTLDVSLLKLQYSLNDVKATRSGSTFKTPFFTSEKFTFSIPPKTILSGRIRGLITVDKPILHYHKGKHLNEDQTSIDHRWATVAQRMLIVPLTGIKVMEGSVLYSDEKSIPQIKLASRSINLTVTNIDGVADEAVPLPSIAAGTATAHGGIIRFRIEFSAAGDSPQFNVRAELVDLNLSHLADFLKSKGSEPPDGLFSVFVQASAEDQRITGFVRPILENISLVSSTEYQSWRSTGFGDGNARHIILEETIDFDSSFSIWSAVAVTLQQAFIEGLMPVIYQTNSKHESQRIRPKGYSNAKKQPVPMRGS
jgi:hypothetical protein